MFNSTRTLIGVLGLLVGVLGSTSAAASALTIPNTFAADTTAVAAEVNANFDSVKTAVDDNAGRVAALEVMVTALQNTINTLQAELATVRDLAPFVSVDPNVIEGLTGPHIIFTGANVHIRNGSGTTNGTPDGQGNLVVGYNEGGQAADRGGSHNVIIGRDHKYLSFGGLVAGRGNTISGVEASVSGGAGNTASGGQASVSGGTNNTASGGTSSVSAGANNTASATQAGVSGGEGNIANGARASVSGGFRNTASGTTASVSGGEANTASGDFGASVSGGVSNTASGRSASVSGGGGNTALGSAASVSGGTNNTASTVNSSVSGGEGCNMVFAARGWGVGDRLVNGNAPVICSITNLDDVRLAPR